MQREYLMAFVPYKGLERNLPGPSHGKGIVYWYKKFFGNTGLRLRIGLRPRTPRPSSLQASLTEKTPHRDDLSRAVM
jgi:hypothetical protein